MNLENALKIQGFTNPLELEWLATQASARRNVVEIGAWKGRSTRAMADNNTLGGIVAVDTWDGTPADPHFKEFDGKDKDWLFKEFMANMSDLHGNVMALRMPSVKAAKFLLERDTKFDMIFIDADHSYEAVRDDVLAWRPLLAEGGLFCGHDYVAGRGGVLRAIDEFVLNVRRVGVGTIWVAG